MSRCPFNTCIALISCLGFTAMFCIGAYKAANASIIAPMQYSQMLWAGTELVFHSQV